MNLVSLKNTQREISRIGTASNDLVIHLLEIRNVLRSLLICRARRTLCKEPSYTIFPVLDIEAPDRVSLFVLDSKATIAFPEVKLEQPISDLAKRNDLAAVVLNIAGP